MQLFLHPLTNFLYKIGVISTQWAFFIHFFSLISRAWMHPPILWRFWVVRTALYSDVHLLGDSHVQRVPWYCRFRFYRDHVLWKTAIFPRREFQCYSGWSCYHMLSPKKTYITILHHTIPYTHPIKTQTIQLGVALKVQVRVFNCQGRQVSTSDPAKFVFFPSSRSFLGRQI